MPQYYSLPNVDPDFYENVNNHVEFNIKQKFGYREPHQEFLKNYISQYNPIDSILLYNGLGTGKTCSSISIAEGFKSYAQNNGKKIVVITKNKNIRENFINELLNGCTENEYIKPSERELYFDSSTKKINKREQLRLKVKTLISKTYSFYTYGMFVNLVLGMKSKTGDRKLKEETKKFDPKTFNFSNTVVIVDEAHNCTQNDMYFALKTILNRSINYRLVLLTATPVFDNVKEIFEMANLLNKDSNFPIRNQLVTTGYVEKADSPDIPVILKGSLVKLTEKAKVELEYSLRGRVSYFPIDFSGQYPSRRDLGTALTPKAGSESVIKCGMSKLQATAYLKALQKDNVSKDILGQLENINADQIINDSGAAAEVAMQLKKSISSSLFKYSNDASTFVYPNGKYGKDGFLDYFKKDKQKKNSWVLINNKDTDWLKLSGTLSVHSSKIAKMLEYIKESKGPVFVYSNYVNYGGTSLLKLILEKNGYSQGSRPGGKSYQAFDSNLTQKQRENIRYLFNSDENKNGDLIKVILGSPLMSEGITLKHVRQEHILEPFWNLSRVEQIIGRGIRKGSHTDLPKSEQKVDVFKYASVLKGPSSQANVSIDLAKYILSEEKNRYNKQAERLLKEISVDCNWTTAFPEKYTNTATCDYTTCDIKCKAKPAPLVLNKSTYFSFINYFEKEKINNVMENIKKLFNKQFIWSYQDIKKNTDSRINRLIVIYCLYIFIKEKVIIQDKFNRDGYLVMYTDKNPSVFNSWFMFQPIEKDPDTTLYEKYFDFQQVKNDITVSQFINEYYPEIKQKKQKQKKKMVTESEKGKLTPQQILENEKIKKRSIYGTKYDKFGKKDSLLRIVDTRNKKNERQDGRKNLTGMACLSFKKDKLVELAQALGVKELKSKEKDYLCSIIEKQLKQLKRILN